MKYLDFEAALRDLRTGAPITGSGGMAHVAVAGSPDKAATYDPANDYASLANPVAITGGMLRFAVPDSVEAVDLYIMCPGGQFLVMKGVSPGTVPFLPVDTNNVNQVAVIPYSVADSAATVEQDTGFDMPTGALILPDVAVNVVAADASETLDFGTATAESGDPNGILSAMPIENLGVAAAKSASTATRGALIGAGTLDRGHVVASTARSLTYTTSSGTDTAKGFVLLPYINANA